MLTSLPMVDWGIEESQQITNITFHESRPWNTDLLGTLIHLRSVLPEGFAERDRSKSFFVLPQSGPQRCSFRTGAMAAATAPLGKYTLPFLA